MVQSIQNLIQGLTPSPLAHIIDTFNLFSTKYRNGVYWILAGDINDLKLDAILSLDPNVTQIVKNSTRSSSKSLNILDPIIMTLSKHYQRPVCRSSLKLDSHITKSDHFIALRNIKSL